jgi:hypothetical protein
MQRSSFDFDVITGPSASRLAPRPEPIPDAGKHKPAPGGSVREERGDPSTDSRSPEDGRDLIGDVAQHRRDR